VRERERQISLGMYVCLSVREKERAWYYIMVQTSDVGLLSARHPKHPEEMGAEKIECMYMRQLMSAMPTGSFLCPTTS